jgi:ankyrin repeat protein
MIAQEGLVATYGLLSPLRKIDPIGNLVNFARKPKMPNIAILPVLSDDEIPDIPLGDIDAVDTDGNTPLLVAAENGHAEMTKALLDRDANLEIHNRISDFTALHSAASRGFKDVVSVLLSKRARIIESRFENAQNSGTALTLAAEFGHAEVVKILLRANANPQGHTRSGNTPLHLAALKGHTDVVRELLSNRRTDVKTRTPSGTTALHFAASNGHNEIVITLLSKGADSSERDNTGWTAAHRAAAGGHKTVVMTLLDVGKDVEHQIALLFMLVGKFEDDHIYPKLLGDTLCKAGNLDEALAAYDTATGLNPFNRNVLRISNIQHGGITCTGCRHSITGIWFHCVACDQLEMCSRCHDRQFHSEDTGHQFMAIPSREWLRTAGLIQEM